MPYADYPACGRCKQALPNQTQGRPRKHCRSCAVVVSREKDKTARYKGPTAKTGVCQGCRTEFGYVSTQTRLYCDAKCKPKNPPATAEENRRRWAEIRADPRKLAAAREKNRRAQRAKAPELAEKRRRQARRNAAKRKLARAAEGPRRERRWYMGWCADCGEPFVDPQPARLVCSPTCGKRRSGRRGRTVRRALKKAAYVEDVWRSKVFARDNWICGICGDPCDREQSVPHPLALTLDHIIPLARGGDHSYANIQTAHFICNCRKRDLLPVALEPSA